MGAGAEGEDIIAAADDQIGDGKLECGPLIESGVAAANLGIVGAEILEAPGFGMAIQGDDEAGIEGDRGNRNDGELSLSGLSAGDRKMHFPGRAVVTGGAGPGSAVGGVANIGGSDVGIIVGCSVG